MSASRRIRVLQNGKMPLPELARELAERYDVTVLTEQPDAAAFLAQYGDAFEYVVTSAGVGLSADVVRALPRLRCVSSFGVGFDSLDKDALVAQGVRVGYTPGVLDACVADMAMGLLIDAARRISDGDRFVRAGQWSQGRFAATTRVSGKRMGILGMGRIGGQVAQRAHGFDMQIGYHNRHAVPDSPHTYHASLHSLAQWCDFLVITAAGGGATRHLVDAGVLKALGPQGILVNVARGSVVDEQALVQALQDSTIAGAGLDVFEDEPHPLPALLALDNVVLTPHMASGTHETRRAMADLVLHNLSQFIESATLVEEVPWSAQAAATTNA